MDVERAVDGAPANVCLLL